MKTTLARLKKLENELSKTRDSLRDLMVDVEAKYENASQAHDDLMRCIDTLSEYV